MSQIRSTTPAIDVYMKLAQYPILSDQIRLRMREELFKRGIEDQNDFEMRVRQHALESQKREGLNDPYSQEDENTWQKRMDTIRDLNTDAAFANNLGPTRLEKIIEEVLNNQARPAHSVDLTFNPEIAPWAVLFDQGHLYEALPPPEQIAVQHHLEELKVVLIKRLISEHLKFIGVAKHIFTIDDLEWIYERLLGSGKIGGKAAGMMLAWRSLQRANTNMGPDISQMVYVPDTFFIGSEIIYEFFYLNKLERFMNQKYLSAEEQTAQYAEIVAACLEAKLPSHIVSQLEDVLKRLDKRPFVVRSSSLLEDNLSYTFIGEYDSIICFNQGNEAENVQAMLDAIRRVYACSFKPSALQKRKEHQLIDYDERMAIMIQPLVGNSYGRYFWPTIVGYGSSRNPFSNTKHSASDGLLRLVLGFDDRVDTPLDAQDTCIISLSYPQYRSIGEGCLPGQSPQKEIKVVNMQASAFEHHPVDALLQPDYPLLPYIASRIENDQLLTISVDDKETGSYALSFEYLTKDPRFVKLMRTALMRLEEVYKKPIQIEFALELIPQGNGLDYELYLLQCHPDYTQTYG